MDTQEQQVIERLKQATNILVTVSTNPSVDQLSAAIGVTLLLNKLGKHATAVYSGKTPSTIEFLQPEKTLEKNTDSLRDFIIALDKSKADKLRYKVEDQMVKIFITPYRTSISDRDLEYSQGDFNVEVVLALGVTRQPDLDQAITSHGRILHDATVISVATGTGEDTLGSINWVDQNTSSLSEMMTQLGLALDNTVLDGQMANALLTGIVAETERFSNQKTSAETMQVSAQLIAAGANQQLVATELSAPVAVAPIAADELADDMSEQTPPDAEIAADGSLQIAHDPNEVPAPAKDEADAELPEPEVDPSVEEIHIDYDGQFKAEATSEAGTEAPQDAAEGDVAAPDEQSNPTDQATMTGSSKLVLQPPTLGGQLTANSEPEGLDPAVDPLAGSPPSPLLHRDAPQVAPAPAELPAEDTASDQPEVAASEPAPEAPTEAEPALPAEPNVDTPAEPNTEAPAVPEPNSPSADTPPEENGEDSSPQTLADLEQFVAGPRPTQGNQDDVPKSDESTQTTASDATPEQPDPEPTVEANQPPVNVDSARDAVQDAMNAVTPDAFEPVKSLNAMPVDLDLGDIPAVNTSPASAFADSSTQVEAPTATQAPTDGLAPEPTYSGNMPVHPHVASDPDLPPGLVTNEPTDNTGTDVVSPSAPPPVPPPMMPPQFGMPQNGVGPNPVPPAA